MQRGLLEPKDTGFVPDAYTCNQQLERENKYLKKEMESYKFAAKYVVTVINGSCIFHLGLDPAKLGTMGVQGMCLTPSNVFSYRIYREL